MSADPKPPEHATPDFEPSPLPTPFELTSLAARLLPPMDLQALEKMERSGYHLATAIRTAAKLWGAALACDVEREVETGRLSASLDRESAGARWNAWSWNRLGLSESAAAYAKETAKWAAKAKARFAHLTFPAKADDVLLAIMGGSNIGRSAGSRHERFMPAWMAAFRDRSIERVREQYRGSEPNARDVLERERTLTGGAKSKFENDPAALQSAIKAAQMEHQQQEDAAVEAQLADLENAARQLRTWEVDKGLACEWLRIWETHSVAEARKKGGEANAKRIAEAKRDAAKGET